LTAMMMSLQGAAQIGSSQAPLILHHYGEGERDIVAFYATTTLDDGEVVPWFPIEEVVVRAERQLQSAAERAQYLRLMINKLHVLPFAIDAQLRQEELDKDLAAAKANR